MPSFSEHCEQCDLVLGKPYGEVHKWLDEFAGKPPYGMKHRRLRHHAEGVEQVRRMFGDDAAKAAQLHIEADLIQDGWTPVMPFPRNEAHYIRLGLF